MRSMADKKAGKTPAPRVSPQRHVFSPSFLLFLPHSHLFSALPLSFFCVQRDAGLPRRTVASLVPLYIKEAESTAADGP